VAVNPKYGRYLSNPLARAEAEQKLKAENQGKAPEAVAAPKAARKLTLTDTGDGRWIGPCPACQAAGGDSKGNHLVLFSDGRFGCIKYKGEDGKDHRREMARLQPALINGIGKNWKPKPRDLSKEKAAIEQASKEFWSAVRNSLAGDLSSLGESAEIPEDPKQHFLLWCKLWQPGDIAWVGERYDSNHAFLTHLFQPVLQAEIMWDKITTEGLDHARGLLWKADADSRKMDQSCGMRLLIVEHDNEGLEGNVALWRYARDFLGLNLRMVISTGGKGWHGIFDAPSNLASMDTKIKSLARLGADAGALSQSCTRVPGARRNSTEKTPGGALQQIIWLAK